MGFDIASAKVVDEPSGFDLSSAKADIPAGFKLDEMGDIVRVQSKHNPSVSEKIGDTLSNAWEASKLEGLAPEVSPLMGLSRVGGYRAIKGLNTATNAVEDAIKAGAGSTYGQKLGNVLSTAGNVVASPLKSAVQLAGELVPESMKGGYQVARAKNPYISQQFKAGKAEGMTDKALEEERKNSGVINYAKAIFGKDININEAEKAKDYADVWKQKALADALMEKAQSIGGRGNYTLGSDASIMLPEGVKLAENSMTGSRARQIGNEATWLPRMIDLLKNKSFGAKAIGIASPRIQTNIGYVAGKGKNAAEMLPAASEMLPAASLEDLLIGGNAGNKFIAQQ